MTINYEITENDILALNRFHARQPANRRRVLKLFGGLYLIGILAFGLITRFSGAWFPFAAFLTLYIGGLYLFQPRLVDRQAKMLIGRGSYKGILGNGRIELSADGLRAVGPIADSLFFWNAVETVRETDEHIFVSFSESLYFLIPKRAFATQADGAAFLRRIEELRAGHGAPIETISRGSWWTQGSSVTETETQTLRG